MILSSIFIILTIILSGVIVGQVREMKAIEDAWRNDMLDWSALNKELQDEVDLLYPETEGLENIVLQVNIYLESVVVPIEVTTSRTLRGYLEMIDDMIDNNRGGNLIIDNSDDEHGTVIPTDDIKYVHVELKETATESDGDGQ